ncbi:LysR family transcriptional regulator [Acetobacter estunensis NRIC 0472]|uniref:LysR family transcriptional regulator n=3 Tax=Acetobacteraceae TaxID=433 RepID=A0A967BAA9_9PROT|nr:MULTISPECIES: LysR family transcriptional regulator [Acetobacteraceae]KFL91496.1 Transcriptional regulator, LysR family [Acetobacter malorum]MCG0995505.1 LysR family transcriptional regulator [Acetobacter indonesiensis]NHO55046.1 LysR family transcriptional regulator [Acetobacter estunensis]NVN38021.1 LysR family transcriptional regulator [Komagataeibacter swingsii]BAK84733.1 transcriptional regulator LysR family [Komagataeibacter medellinensis NBRC 3288]
MRLPDFEAWAIFAKVAELGSFARAAEEIQLSKPTVSKAVSRLEQTLGIALFNRNSRHISLTETGRALLGYANRIVTEAEAAEAEARGDMQRPSGRIRITAPVTFGIRHLAPVLPEFMRRYPEIDLNISFSDAIVDVVADGYDIALRISALADSSLRARRLCDVGLFLVASSAWLNTVGRPEHPRDLEDCKSFVYTNTAAPGMIRLRKKNSGKEFVLPQTSRFRADNAEAFLPSLEEGLGYGLFPEFMVSDGLQEARLERILPEWEGPVISLYLITPPSPMRPNRVKALIDYLIKAFEHPPWVKTER